MPAKRRDRGDRPAVASRSKHPGGEDDSPDETVTWDGLATVHARIRRRLEGDLVAAHGLALVEYDVLSRLAESGGSVRMSDLATAVELSRSGLTRVLDVLEAQRMATRKSSAQDGRVVLASITEAGRGRLAVAHVTHAATLRAAFAPLTPKQARSLAKAAAALSNA